MRLLTQTSLAVLATACAVFSADPAAAQTFSQIQFDQPRGGSQSGPGRQSMERCVDRVLGGLARNQAPESQAGPAVLAQCDAPLRAAVSDAIRSGEAFICSNVESCLPMARERTSYEARDRYRQLQQR